jgi:2-polyprenyl-6-methoxyphenol hydroxylase-like FAD-dependent oxidoreductase
MEPLSRVLIIGGGIGGLGLAQGLLKASVPFRVFERESALNVRSQGYRVRINDAGQVALKALLPPSLYLRLVESLPPNAKSVAPVAHLEALTGDVQNLPRNGPPANQSPGTATLPQENSEQMNADRGVLRDILMHGLEGNVEFGKEVVSYEITPTGVRALFSDGTEETGTLLVAADGTRSRIRKQFLSSSKLLDTNTRIIYGKTILNQELEMNLNNKALKGLTLVADRSTKPVLVLLLEAMRFQDNQYREKLPENYVYWALMAQNDRFIDYVEEELLLSLSSLQAAKLAQEMTEKWDDSFRQLFASQNVSHTSIIPVLSADPDLPSWTPSNRVTLIGDAIHAMSPTAAAGAATALRDAALLVELLTKNPIQAEAIGEYEQRMRHYARDTIQKSGFGGKLVYGEWDFSTMKEVQF